MSDVAMQERKERPLKGSALASAPVPRVETPIVPQATISARALVTVVAIMTFLAALTSGAVLLIRGAAAEWQAEVAREITIQIRPANGRDIEADVAKAAALTRAAPGIAEVRPYSKEEAARLLEPWLGGAAKLDELPIPRMIVVKTAPGAGTDLAQLRRSLAEQVPTAALDDHRAFVERMRAISRTAVAVGLAVLLLVVAATVLSVTFATRAAMAANRPVIEVLHLIGAKDNFIARHFQRHFLQLGLKGGIIGGGSALLLFAAAEFARDHLGGTEGDQFTSLFGSLSLGPLAYAAVLALVALIAAVTGLTSRRTVTRTIATMH